MERWKTVENTYGKRYREFGNISKVSMNESGIGLFFALLQKNLITGPYSQGNLNILIFSSLSALFRHQF